MNPVIVKTQIFELGHDTGNMIFLRRYVRRKEDYIINLTVIGQQRLKAHDGRLASIQENRNLLTLSFTHTWSCGITQHS